MEIHLLQFVPWLGILGHCTPSSSPCSDAGVVRKSKTNMLQAWKEERQLNQSLSSPLNVLISPGVKGQGMGQDFKNAAVKYMCKSRVIIVSVLYRNVVTAVALWMYAQLPAAMLFAANMAAMCVRAEWSATHHVSAPILASMRACMNDSSLCVCVRMCVSNLSSLLPDSIKSNPAHQTCFYAVQHPGAISLIWFGARVLSDQSDTMIWQCHTAADILWLCACILSLLWMISD